VFRLDIVPEQAQALAAALGRAAGASLFHPSIVEPIAAGVEGTLAYRAEEYVAAESLDVAMRHYAPAPIEKVLPFITQLAGAIDFARAAGVGHGGLHPRDIFVTPDEARATGFGVIEALEEVGIRAPVRRPYTAPERIDGQPWGTPADIFSLAAITFELLTGRRPAGTGTVIGALPASDHTAALHAVLARAMHDEPAQRYASALAFAAALESAARGQPEPPAVVASAVVPPPSPAPPPRESVREPEPVALPDQAVGRAPEPEEDEEPEHPAEHVGVTAATSGTQKPAGHTEPPKPDRAEVAEPLLFPVGDDPTAERFIDEFPLEATARLPAKRAPHSEPEPEPEPLVPVEHRELLEPGESLEAEEPTTPLMYEEQESSRPAVLPMAIGVVLGLLAGFAGGYFVGSRDRLAPDTTTAAVAPAAAAPSVGTPSGVAPPDQPRQYSEQKVSPPATPTAATPTEPKTTEAPPVVQETAPAPTRGAATRETPPAAAAPVTRERAKPTGTIAVKSTPSHAGVTVNGTWRGRTPLTLEHLPFGRYVVRVVQPGYRPAQEEFMLGTREAEHTFTAKLEANAAAARHEPAAPAPVSGFFGTLYVDSRPRGATVLLDGKNIGITPLSLGEVPIGSHVVRVELAGKRPWTSSTTVVAGQTARVTMSLEDKQ